MKIKMLCKTIAILLLFSCHSTQQIDYNSSTSVSNNESQDNCYEKSLLPLRYLEQDGRLPIYDGNQIQSDNLDTVHIFTNSYFAEQYRRQLKDKNYSGRKFTTKDLEENMEELIIVADTSKIKDYFWQVVNQENFVTFKHTNHVQVLCQDEITDEVMGDICEKLIENGFNLECSDLRYEGKLKATLTTYQKRNGLPFGTLNIRTLRKLNIL